MKKTLRQTLALLVSGTLALGMLAACGNTSTSSGTTGSTSAAASTGGSGQSISLVYQYWDFIPNQEEVFAEFSRQYKEETGIDVKIEGQLNTDASWQDTLKTQIATGSGPDVFHMDLNQFSAWKDTVIQPLSPFYEADFWNQFVPNAIEVWKANDNYYAVSNSYSTVAVLYNVDALKEAGVTMGTTWTLEEFEKAMETFYNFYDGKTITYTDGSTYPYNVLDTTAAMYYLWLFNGVYGGTPFADTNNVAQKAYVDGLVKMAEWADKGWLKSANDVGPGNRATAFSSGGNTAFMITGDWTPTGFYRQHNGIGGETIEVTTNYASIIAPVGKSGKPFSEIYNQGVVMNKNLTGDKASAAAAFIKYMTTTDAWLKVRGPEVGGLGLPARTEWAEEYATTWFANPIERSAFIETAEMGIIASPDHQAGGINITSDILQAAIDAVLDEAWKDGPIDEAAIREFATQKLEEQQALLNLQLSENEIELDNPDAKVK